MTMERTHDRAVPHRHPAGRPRRPGRPALPHPLARRGRRRRVGLRLSAGPAEGTRRALAHRVRLARARGPAQRTAALHHRDRRPDRALRSRPLHAAGRARAGPHARLARFLPRIPGRRRAVVARLPPGDPVHPGFRLLRPHPRARLGRPAGRAGLGGTHAPSRVRALRGTGRRLRLGHLPGARRGGTRAGCRCARQLPADPAGPGRRRRPVRHGRGPAGQGQAAHGPPPAVPGAPGHHPADPRLRPDRLTGRPTGVDRRALRAVDRPGHARRRRAGAHRRLAVLADRHRGLLGAPRPRVAAAGPALPGPGGRGRVRARITQSVRPLAERLYDIRHWSEFDRGGHFAAMEVPELFTGDVRDFFLSGLKRD